MLNFANFEAGGVHDASKSKSHEIVNNTVSLTNVKTFLVRQ
jgi:hypothetical protein